MRCIALICLTATGFFSVFGGCGGTSAPQRVVVSGKVTFAGKPIKKGDIRFVPVNGGDAPVTLALIENGQYSAGNKGGVPAGVHRVEITAWRPKPGFDVPADKLPPGIDPGQLPREQYIPAKYNSSSTLKATVESGSGKIVQDFVLTD